MYAMSKPEKNKNTDKKSLTNATERKLVWKTEIAEYQAQGH